MKCPADYNDTQEEENAPVSPPSPQLSGGMSHANRKRQCQEKKQGRQDSFDAANRLLTNKRNTITTPTPEGDDDEISSNYLCDIKAEPIDHIKAECINECYSDIKVEKHSSDEEEFNVKNFSCQHCDKTYTLRKSLVHHMTIHTGVKKHSCNQCSKNFSWKDILLKHLKTHTGEKNHLCAKCGKGFTHRSSLHKHMTTHHTRKKHLFM